MTAAEARCSVHNRKVWRLMSKWCCWEDPREHSSRIKRSKQSIFLKTLLVALHTHTFLKPSSNACFYAVSPASASIRPKGLDRPRIFNHCSLLMHSTAELKSLTVVALKEKLRAHGLKVSGRKLELITRLQEHAESQQLLSNVDEETYDGADSSSQIQDRAERQQVVQKGEEEKNDVVGSIADVESSTSASASEVQVSTSPREAEPATDPTKTRLSYNERMEAKSLAKKGKNIAELELALSEHNGIIIVDCNNLRNGRHLSRNTHSSAELTACLDAWAENHGYAHRMALVWDKYVESSHMLPHAANFFAGAAQEADDVIAQLCSYVAGACDILVFTQDKQLRKRCGLQVRKAESSETRVRSFSHVLMMELLEKDGWRQATKLQVEKPQFLSPEDMMPSDTRHVFASESVADVGPIAWKAVLSHVSAWFAEGCDGMTVAPASHFSIFNCERTLKDDIHAMALSSASSGGKN